MAELRTATGFSQQRLTRALTEFKALGRLVIHRVRREALDGRRAVVVAYTILPPPKKKR